MQTIFEHIREHLLAKKNLATIDWQQRYKLWSRTEWCSRFEKLMRNRLLIGLMRYGPLNTGKRYNRVASMRKHIELYEHSGNLEHLVDVANMCMVEFVESSHPKRHFHAIDDHDHHAKMC